MHKVFTPLLALLLLVLAHAAAAHSIDGDWCSEDANRRLYIEGAQIHTPGGQVAQGHYSRHLFDYTAPPGEPEAGLGIQMQQLGDDLMRRQAGNAAPDLWHRCDLSS